MPSGSQWGLNLAFRIATIEHNWRFYGKWQFGARAQVLAILLVEKYQRSVVEEKCYWELLPQFDRPISRLFRLLPDVSPPRSLASKALLALGALGGVVFIVIFIVLGVFGPGYEFVRHHQRI